LSTPPPLKPFLYLRGKKKGEGKREKGERSGVEPRSFLPYHGKRGRKEGKRGEKETEERFIGNFSIF